MKNFVVSIVAYNRKTNNTQCWTQLYFAKSLAEAKGLFLDNFQKEYPEHTTINFFNGFEIKKDDLK